MSQQRCANDKSAQLPASRSGREIQLASPTNERKNGARMATTEERAPQSWPCSRSEGEEAEEEDKLNYRPNLSYIYVMLLQLRKCM